MEKLSFEQLKEIFKDILNGYNKFKHKSFGEVYIKHYNAYDNAKVDDKREDFYKHAIKMGLNTNQQQLQFAIEQGDWNPDNDNRIREYKSSLSNLRDTKNKLVIDAQKKSIDVKIKNQTEELKKLELEKMSLMGFTAESYSSKRSNEFFIFESLRKDRLLNERVFSEEDFDDLDNETLSELIGIYNEVSSIFSEKNLRRVSYSSTFLNLFYLSPESIYEFYGKPVVELTFYQIELFSNARMFKNLASNSKYPPSAYVYQDPDSVIEWMENAKSSNEVEQTQSSESSSQSSGGKESVGGGRSYVGASKEDLKKLAKDDENLISLSSEARKKGGNLNMQDIMKLHGIKV